MADWDWLLEEWPPVLNMQLAGDEIRVLRPPDTMMNHLDRVDLCDRVAALEEHLGVLAARTAELQTRLQVLEAVQQQHHRDLLPHQVIGPGLLRRPAPPPEQLTLPGMDGLD